MAHSFFSPDMKMADLVHANYINLLVINRFGIHLGFGEKTVAEICNKSKINIELFLLVCNIFYDRDFEPDTEQIAACPAEDLLVFLRNSHYHYRTVSLPAIKTDLRKLSQTCTPVHGKALERFFEEYRFEVEKHLSHEDKTVFPYVEQFINQTRNPDFKGYSIQQFEDNHDNIELKLEDLKNIIIKYIPCDNNDVVRIALLDRLFQFEEDLNRHALIEDKLFVPIVLKLEKK